MSDWSDGALASNNSVAGFESDFGDWEAGDYAAPYAQDSVVPQLNEATAVGGWVSGADLPPGSTTDVAPNLTGWVSGSDLPGGATTSTQLPAVDDWSTGYLSSGYVDGGAASQSASRTARSATSATGAGQTVATTSAATGGASGVNRTGQQKTSGVSGFLDTLSAGLKRFAASVSPATSSTRDNTARPNNTAKAGGTSAANAGQARSIYGGSVPLVALAALAWLAFK